MLTDDLITDALEKARELCHDPDDEHTYSTGIGSMRVERERTLHVGRCEHCDRLAIALLRERIEAHELFRPVMRAFLRDALRGVVYARITVPVEVDALIDDESTTLRAAVKELGVYNEIA